MLGAVTLLTLLISMSGLFALLSHLFSAGGLAALLTLLFSMSGLFMLLPLLLLRGFFASARVGKLLALRRFAGCAGGLRGRRGDGRLDGGRRGDDRAFPKSALGSDLLALTFELALAALLGQFLIGQCQSGWTELCILMRFLAVAEVAGGKLVTGGSLANRHFVLAPIAIFPALAFVAGGFMVSVARGMVIAPIMSAATTVILAIMATTGCLPVLVSVVIGQGDTEAVGGMVALLAEGELAIPQTAQPVVGAGGIG